MTKHNTTSLKNNGLAQSYGFLPEETLIPSELHRYLHDLDLSFTTTDIEFVNQLQSRHIARYSFNSLAVVLGQEMPLDLPHLSRKIVDQGLGGYCFEHNKLSFELLQALGFKVRLLLARVIYNQEKDVPRTHRITLLELNDNIYIVDTGFGSLGPRHAVELTPDKVQTIGDETFRIKAREHGEYDLQIIKEGEFFSLYRFDLNRYTDADCLTGHFFSHRYPKAGFVNNLVVSLKLAEKVLSLRNHQLFVIQQGETQITPVTSAEHLYQLLLQTFSLPIDRAVADHLFERFVQPQLQNTTNNSH
ncbi:arylamine N-acetyltransferase family protein [Oceanospirillum beijerinckii]|uniref:arylamine N-acetyltransferase family protein n=1 Tax=Oceanospirillum beijerinckii TaxID=64976 RepID=UPI0004036D5C|nr:arylamine N-acetyltransferase [Oceanospirillum beijerinckii]MAC46102.1 arylamine N-acetyltransferase [Oceanospirillum sp.]